MNKILERLKITLWILKGRPIYIINNQTHGLMAYNQDGEVIAVSIIGEKMTPPECHLVVYDKNPKGTKKMKIKKNKINGGLNGRKTSYRNSIR